MVSTLLEQAERDAGSLVLSTGDFAEPLVYTRRNGSFVNLNGVVSIPDGGRDYADSRLSSVVPVRFLVRAGGDGVADPNIGDTVTRVADGTSYVIDRLDVNAGILDIVARRMDSVRTQHTVRFDRANQVADGYGATTVTWETMITSAGCDFRPVQTDDIADRGRRDIEITHLFDVPFGQTLEPGESLRDLLDYFMGDPSSEEIRAVVVCDSRVRFFEVVNAVNEGEQNRVVRIEATERRDGYYTEYSHNPSMTTIPMFPLIGGDIVADTITMWGKVAEWVGTRGYITQIDTLDVLVDAFHLARIAQFRGSIRYFVQVSDLSWGDADYKAKLTKILNEYGDDLVYLNLSVEGRTHLIDDAATIESYRAHVKAIRPDAKCGVSIQFEGAIADNTLQAAIEASSAMDVVMLTTYPYIAGLSAHQINRAYYERVRKWTSKPLVVAECGWADTSPQSESLQALALANIHESMRTLDCDLINWFFSIDTDWWPSASFRDHGLLRTDFTAKPAQTNFAAEVARTGGA